MGVVGSVGRDYRQHKQRSQSGLQELPNGEQSVTGGPLHWVLILFEPVDDGVNSYDSPLAGNSFLTYKWK